MTAILLVRHAMCDSVGHTLTGRAPGISLNATGRVQAEQLGRRFAGSNIAAVHTSPLERARETACAIAAVVHCAPIDFAGLTEIDFGEWTGCGFDALAPLPEWQRFNLHRSTMRVPGGELMLEAQARAVSAIEDLRSHYADDAAVVAVSHSDIIKALIAHYAGISLDSLQRIDIEPASVSILSLTPWGDRITRVNDVGSLV